MKKMLLNVVNTSIWALSFLFLISSFFKIISVTIIENYVYDNNFVLCAIWLLGIMIAIIFTPHLYRWILHLRHPKLS